MTYKVFSLLINLRKKYFFRLLQIRRKFFKILNQIFCYPARKNNFLKNTFNNFRNKVEISLNLTTKVKWTKIYVNFKTIETTLKETSSLLKEGSSFHICREEI